MKRFLVGELIVGKVVSLPKEDAKGGFTAEVELWEAAKLTPPAVRDRTMEWASFIAGLVVGAFAVGACFLL